MRAVLRGKTADKFLIQVSRENPASRGTQIGPLTRRTTNHRRTDGVRARPVSHRVTLYVACAIVSFRARSPRNENRAAIFFSTAPPAQSHMHLRPGVWSPDPLR